jgi:hypothetical protein
MSHVLRPAARRARWLPAALLLTTCTDTPLVKNIEDTRPVFDNKLKVSGKVCTSDPADLIFPLKVMFVIDTSQSMNFNDPVKPTEPDPLLQTGRSKSIGQVIAQFIDIHAKISSTYCNTGDTGCEKGATACAACGPPNTAMCIGPDCCKAPPCKGTPACPALGGTNGTCVPLCDVTKAGCQPGEKACPDCPNAGDQCAGGVCGKHLDPGVEFAIARFGSAKQVLTRNRDGVEGFTNDIKELVTSLAGVNNGGSVTDYEGAMSMVFNTLSRDMADMQKKNAAAVARSKYVVIFLSDGQPDPRVNDENDWKGVPSDLQNDLLPPGSCKSTGTGYVCDTESITAYNVDTRILRRVKEVMGLKTIYHVGDIKMHTAYVAGQTPSWLQDQATYLLKQMSLVGQGTFRNFVNGEEINFLHVDFSSLRRVFRLKNFIVTNLNARPAGGTLFVDSDGDGIDDQLEFDAGMDSTKYDTDGDGFSDTVEYFFRASGWDPLNPADADCPLEGNDLDGDGFPDDTDGDGLLDCEERFLGTSKDLFDTDADGIPDGIEVKFGTNPAVNDVDDDIDFDGMPNGDEIRLHTDPRTDDSAHRSRMSYRYNVRQVGTGIETVGRRCSLDSDCPSKTDCKEGYCRCILDDGCSSKATCTKDLDCLVAGETCDAGTCKGKWTCQQPSAIASLKEPELVCAARKNIACYQFDVENIALVTPKAPTTGGDPGWNQINLYFGEVPFDNPNDYGNFMMACVRSWYQTSTGSKLPATGKVEVPDIAWHDPREYSMSYPARLTDDGGGKRMACGNATTGPVFCNAGDLCINAARQRCRLANCVCPDGAMGICPAKK